MAESPTEGRKRGPQLLRGGGGEQRLPAMTRCGDSLSANDGQRRDIFAVARFRVAGMQAHAHAHGADLAPAFAMQRPLRIERRARCVGGVFEYRAERIADDLEYLSAMRVDGILEQ